MGNHYMGSTYVRSDDDTNKNGDASLIIGTKPPSAGEAVIRGLFSYNLSAIPAGSTITGATFTLKVNNNDTTSTNSLVTLDLRSLSSSFDETTVTFTTSPSLGATALTSTSANPRTVAAGDALTFGYRCLRQRRAGGAGQPKQLKFRRHPSGRRHDQPRDLLRRRRRSEQ